AALILTCSSEGCPSVPEHPQRRGSFAWHAFRSEMTLLGSDPERSIGRSVAVIRAAPLHDLEDEPFAPGWRVELEILAIGVTVIEEILGPQAIRQFRLQ